MHFQIFSEKIEFTKLNLKIEFHEPLNGSWKVLGCNTVTVSDINKEITADNIISEVNVTYDDDRQGYSIERRNCL